MVTTEYIIFAPVLLFRLIYQGKVQTLREALKTILGILERIISRPDDIAARRLRITHPVLKVNNLIRISTLLHPLTDFNIAQNFPLFCRRSSQESVVG